MSYNNRDEHEYKSYTVEKGTPEPRVCNAFFTFIFSLFPGTGHMYQGFIKKGAFYMASFLGLMYLSDLTHTAGPALAAVVLWYVTFFDSFKTRRDIIAGRPVKENMKDLFTTAVIVLFALGILIVIQRPNIVAIIVSNVFGVAFNVIILGLFAAMCIYLVVKFLKK